MANLSKSVSDHYCVKHRMRPLMCVRYTLLCYCAGDVTVALTTAEPAVTRSRVRNAA